MKYVTTTAEELYYQLDRIGDIRPDDAILRLLAHHAAEVRLGYEDEPVPEQDGHLATNWTMIGLDDPDEGVEVAWFKDEGWTDVGGSFAVRWIWRLSQQYGAGGAERSDWHSQRPAAAASAHPYRTAPAAAVEGAWFQTFSGRKVSIANPQAGDIHVNDIAHALAHLCRFGGHARAFYSVAQHSVLVSLVVPEELALVGLLHDATEAYVGDVIRPLKQMLPSYQSIERDWAWAIGEHFFGPGSTTLVNLPPEVKRADEVVLSTELRDLLCDGPAHALWDKREPPLPDVIEPLGPVEARSLFMARFIQLREGLRK